MGQFIVVIPPVGSKLYSILDFGDVIDLSNAATNLNIALSNAANKVNEKCSK